jgi:hypothetical protein
MIIGMVKFMSRLMGRTPPLTEAVVELSTIDVQMQNARMRQELGVDLRYPTYRQGLAQVAAYVGAAEEEE